jgi:hypothetical protein
MSLVIRTNIYIDVDGHWSVQESADGGVAKVELTRGVGQRVVFLDRPETHGTGQRGAPKR